MKHATSAESAPTAKPLEEADAGPAVLFHARVRQGQSRRQQRRRTPLAVHARLHHFVAIESPFALMQALGQKFDDGPALDQFQTAKNVSFVYVAGKIRQILLRHGGPPTLTLSRKREKYTLLLSRITSLSFPWRATPTLLIGRSNAAISIETAIVYVIFFASGSIFSHRAASPPEALVFDMTERVVCAGHAQLRA